MGCEGYLAYSTAGRDRGRVFIVLKEDGNYCYLADGRLRKVENPKKKKKKHTEITDTHVVLEENITNKGLRRIINNFLEGREEFGQR